MKRYEALEMQYTQQREQNKTLARANNRNKKGANKDAANRQAAYVEESSKVQVILEFIFMSKNFLETNRRKERANSCNEREA